MCPKDTDETTTVQCDFGTKKAMHGKHASGEELTTINTWRMLGSFWSNDHWGWVGTHSSRHT